MCTDLFFLLSIFTIAFLYSIIGHGGASGYIAMMVIWSVPFIHIKPVALILNIIVSALAFAMYYKAGHFKLKLFGPLIIASVPAAFAGGMITIDQPFVNVILALILLFSGYKLIFRDKIDLVENDSIPIPYLLIVGAAIGFLSGLLGIGGGILLSPVLILFRWANSRSAAAICAPFILLNSLSGISAFTMNGGVIPSGILPLIILVVIGGFFGSSIGSRNFSLFGLRVVLSVTLVFAAIKLISL